MPGVMGEGVGRGEEGSGGVLRGKWEEEGWRRGGTHFSL
jgi:hypothetical protein